MATAKSIEEIEAQVRAAFAAKGWEVASYNYQPSPDEYHYEVDIETENYPELVALGDSATLLSDAYMAAFDEVEKVAFRAHNDWGSDCSGGCILVDRKAQVLAVAKHIPARLSITLPTPTS